jgi:multidrug efflux pump subunit AcrA (membrane-fusion protein)
VQAEMSVQTANANLGYTRILAPMDGEVLGIVTREGQTIVSSQIAPTILVLADLDKMQVKPVFRSRYPENPSGTAAMVLRHCRPANAL